MKQYCLKIQSKNEKSLKNFLHFFSKHLKTKSNVIQKTTTIQTNRKIVTFLKSPHVNKTAQEHFEAHLFSKKILIKGFYLEKNLIFLKKILTKLFQDISIHLEFVSNKQVNKKDYLSVLDSNNFKLSKKKFFKTNFKRSKQKIVLKENNNKKSSLFYLVRLLNTLSVFGEIYIIFFSKKKNNSLSSSAVEQRTENPCVDSSNLSSDKKNKLIMKNYLWNMFANIKNGQMSGHSIIFQRRKKICEAFLKILWAEGFILGYKIDEKNTNQLKIFLKYTKNKPAIHSIKFLSKPSRRLYYSTKQIWKIDSNKSFIIFSTNKGLKSIIECKKLRIGGEPFIIIN